MPLFTIDPNERITYKVWYRDDDLLIVGKPPGIVTTPGKGHDRNSLLNGLFATYGPKLQKLGKARDFGLLHRLDRDASGLLLVGLRNESYDRLRAAFEERSIAKFYWALCARAPGAESGVIRKPIAEYEGKAGGGTRTKKLAKVSSTGKPAVTAYRVLSRSPKGALLECRAVTGRLHQVRVHLEAIGCPILGDDLYAPGGVREAAPRLALHAHRTAFAHPINGSPIDVRCPWPQDLRATLRRLGLPRPDVTSPPGVGAKAAGPGS